MASWLSPDSLQTYAEDLRFPVYLHDWTFFSFITCTLGFPVSAKVSSCRVSSHLLRGVYSTYSDRLYFCLFFFFYFLKNKDLAQLFKISSALGCYWGYVNDTLFHVPIRIRPRQHRYYPMRWIVIGDRDKSSKNRYRRWSLSAIKASLELFFTWEKMHLVIVWHTLVNEWPTKNGCYDGLRHLVLFCLNLDQAECLTVLFFHWQQYSESCPCQSSVALANTCAKYVRTCACTCTYNYMHRKEFWNKNKWVLRTTKTESAL